MVRAAGAVLWRKPGLDGGDDRGLENAAGPEVALVHRPKYDDWTFPKGKLKAGEHVLRAVIREVEEETGFTPRLGRRLRPVHYFKDGRPKRVDYWLATVAEEGTGDRFVPNIEVDRLEWLTVPAAESRLTYRRDTQLLHEAVAGPLRTTPYIILRHGSAGEKRDWLGDDVLRPLDPLGRAQAGRLTGLVSGFAPLRLVSSCTARCIETVLPCALRARVGVTTDLAFTVGLTTPDGAADRMTDLIRDGMPTLVCTHGELLTGIVPELCARLDGKPPDEPALRKGGFWILHVADGTLAALERHSV